MTVLMDGDHAGGGKGASVVKPWIVRLPTTLVKLKGDADLPVFRLATPPDPAPGP